MSTGPLSRGVFLLLTPCTSILSAPPLTFVDENEAGESAWVAPYADADEGEGELVNGRRLKAGWRKVGPDNDGDIWCESPSAPCCYPLFWLQAVVAADAVSSLRSHHPCPPRSPQRSYHHSNRADENAAGESLWEPPYADEGGVGGELVNGRRLKAGWRKVGPDDDGDIWYENAAGER